MMSAFEQPLKFRLNKMRSVEAVDFLSQQWPGITQYYICKAMFFADRDHLSDWGDVISGDSYSALENGPVPSRIYDLLKPGGGGEDADWLAYFNERINVQQEGRLRHVYSNGLSETPHLASSHREYLSNWLQKLRPLSFGTVADLAHNDASWQQAWKLGGNSNDMDLTLWIASDAPERKRAIDDVYETSLFSHETHLSLSKAF